MPKKTSAHNRKSLRRLVVIAGIAAILILTAVISAYQLRRIREIAAQPSVSPTPSSLVTPVPTPIPKPVGTVPPASTPTPVPSTAASAAPLAPPTGNFRSSAVISLNGTEESTCQTEHGTTCQLIVKNSAGTEIARIPIPEVDSAGSHLVTWEVKKYIASPGKYTLTALATNGARSSTSAAYSLEVTN